MRHIIIILSLLFTSLSFNAIATLDTTYTAAKELQSIDSMEVDYAQLLELAKHNIVEARCDSDRLTTYNWYVSITPLIWRLKLSLWIDENYPNLKTLKK